MLNGVRIREMLREVNLTNTTQIFDELKQQAVDDPRVKHWKCWEKTGAEYWCGENSPQTLDAVTDLLGFMLRKSKNRLRTS